jgi:hypothetical protein
LQLSKESVEISLGLIACHTEAARELSQELLSISAGYEQPPNGGAGSVDRQVRLIAEVQGNHLAADLAPLEYAGANANWLTHAVSRAVNGRIAAAGARAESLLARGF